MSVFSITSGPEKEAQYEALLSNLRTRREAGLKNWLVLYDNGRRSSRFLRTRTPDCWVFCDIYIDGSIPPENTGITIDLTEDSLIELLQHCKGQFDYITTDSDGPFNERTLPHFATALRAGGFYAFDKHYVAESSSPSYRLIAGFSPFFAGSAPMVPGRIVEMRSHRSWLPMVRIGSILGIKEAVDIMTQIDELCDGKFIPYIRENPYAFESFYVMPEYTPKNKKEKYLLLEPILLQFEKTHGAPVLRKAGNLYIEAKYTFTTSYFSDLQYRLYEAILSKWHVPSGEEPSKEDGTVCLYGPAAATATATGGKRRFRSSFVTRRDRRKRQRSRKYRH